MIFLCLLLLFIPQISFGYSVYGTPNFIIESGSPTPIPLIYPYPLYPTETATPYTFDLPNENILNMAISLDIELAPGFDAGNLTIKLQKVIAGQTPTPIILHNKQSSGEYTTNFYRVFTDSRRYPTPPINYDNGEPLFPYRGTFSDYIGEPLSGLWELLITIDGPYLTPTPTKVILKSYNILAETYPTPIPSLNSIWEPRWAPPTPSIGVNNSIYPGTIGSNFECYAYLPGTIKESLIDGDEVWCVGSFLNAVGNNELGSYVTIPKKCFFIWNKNDGHIIAPTNDSRDIWFAGPLYFGETPQAGLDNNSSPCKTPNNINLPGSVYDIEKRIRPTVPIGTNTPTPFGYCYFTGYFSRVKIPTYTPTLYPTPIPTITESENYGTIFNLLRFFDNDYFKYDQKFIPFDDASYGQAEICKIIDLNSLFVSKMPTPNVFDNDLNPVLIGGSFLKIWVGDENSPFRKQQTSCRLALIYDKKFNLSPTPSPDSSGTPFPVLFNWNPMIGDDLFATQTPTPTGTLTPALISNFSVSDIDIIPLFYTYNETYHYAQIRVIAVGKFNQVAAQYTPTVFPTDFPNITPGEYTPIAIPTVYRQGIAQWDLEFTKNISTGNTTIIASNVIDTNIAKIGKNPAGTKFLKIQRVSTPVADNEYEFLVSGGIIRKGVDNSKSSYPTPVANRVRQLHFKNGLIKELGSREYDENDVYGIKQIEINGMVRRYLFGTFFSNNNYLGLSSILESIYDGNSDFNANTFWRGEYFTNTNNEKNNAYPEILCSNLFGINDVIYDNETETLLTFGRFSDYQNTPAPRIMAFKEVTITPTCTPINTPTEINCELNGSIFYAESLVDLENLYIDSENFNTTFSACGGINGIKLEYATNTPTITNTPTVTNTPKNTNTPENTNTPTYTDTYTPTITYTPTCIDGWEGYFYKTTPNVIFSNVQPCPRDIPLSVYNQFQYNFFKSVIFYPYLWSQTGFRHYELYGDTYLLQWEFKLDEIKTNPTPTPTSRIYKLRGYDGSNWSDWYECEIYDNDSIPYSSGCTFETPIPLEGTGNELKSAEINYEKSMSGSDLSISFYFELNDFCPGDNTKFKEVKIQPGASPTAIVDNFMNWKLCTDWEYTRTPTYTNTYTFTNTPIPSNTPTITNTSTYTNTYTPTQPPPNKSGYIKLCKTFHAIPGRYYQAKVTSHKISVVAQPDSITAYALLNESDPCGNCGCSLNSNKVELNITTSTITTNVPEYPIPINSSFGCLTIEVRNTESLEDICIDSVEIINTNFITCTPTPTDTPNIPNVCSYYNGWVIEVDYNYPSGNFIKLPGNCYRDYCFPTPGPNSTPYISYAILSSDCGKNSGPPGKILQFRIKPIGGDWVYSTPLPVATYTPTAID